jgi:uncharacterized protein YdeI (YjbR/CyaY-like superfamily)
MSNPSGDGTAVYFPSAAAFWEWLEGNHARASSVVVGFHKVHTRTPSLSWSDSVDAALCWGWIDGVRRGVDGGRYTIRFTPRRATSAWSAVNIAKVGALEAAGRMRPAGRAAFAARRSDKSCIYSYETRPQDLPEHYQAVLDASPGAASDFAGRTPSYRRAAVWWVVSAKAEGTRARRIAAIVECHGRGKTIPALTRPDKR